MSSKSHNNLNVDDIERELENSDTEFENYDSDSDPEYLMSGGESDSNDEEVVAHGDPVIDFLEEDWSNTVLNLRRVDFTGKSAGLLHEIVIEVSTNILKPIDVFFSIIDNDILLLMCNETNRYAHQRLNSGPVRRSSRMSRWKDVDIDEMKKFLGVLMFSGVVVFPTYESYWKKDSLYYHELFHKIGMSYNRFIIILKCWHFVDNNIARDNTDSYYNPQRKSLVWYKKVAMELLFGITVVNSMIIFNKQVNKKLTLLSFTESLSRSILCTEVTDKSESVNIQKNISMHFLEQFDRQNGKMQRKRCHGCYSSLREDGQLSAEEAGKKAKKANTHCKLFVSIYYSARSTASIHFILTKLKPLYCSIQKYVFLDLVPFGKAYSTNIGFYCMNGRIECRANTIHNCVFNQFPHNSSAHLEYLSCALQHVDNTIHIEEKCAGHVGLSIDEIQTCATTRKGYLLMLEAEIDTKDKTHGPRFVPSYVFDDFYNDRDQRLAQEDFEAILCQKLIDHGFINVCNTMNNTLRVNQLFSMSMASAIEFKKKKNIGNFIDADETVKFTVLMNNMFDSLSRKYPVEGIKKNSHDIEVLKEAFEFINEWESNLKNQLINKDDFLTTTTADGLKITLKSTIDLIDYLLDDCNYKYVLTAKLNQDCLEKFFGIIRQVAGPNDHPSTPTFLQLYRMLSVYSLIKPPKSGNCTIFEDNIPIITIADLKEIISDPTNTPAIINKIENLKQKINDIVDNGCWEADDIFLEHNYSDSTVFDCLVYYLAGYISKRLVAKTKCELCKLHLKNLNTSKTGPEADLVNIKSRGFLTHPNNNIFKIFKSFELSFTEFADAPNVFEYFLSQNITFDFPCTEHRTDVLMDICSYYLIMRMRPYSYQQNQNNKKINKTKKKNFQNWLK
ncbi:hypothetical protein ACI65C_013168, partial [Semiaphis heraclei]